MRLVRAQLAALCLYLGRQLRQEAEMAQKMARDDGTDPAHFPFLDLCSSVMDIDAPGQVAAAQAFAGP